MNVRALPATAVAVLLFVAACSGDDEADPSTSSSTSTTTSTVEPATTPPESTGPDATTQPSTAPTSSSAPGTSQPSSTTSTSTQPAALEPVIQALLDRYDQAVTTILTDPRVTSDPSSPAVTEYLALFAPDSTFAQGALNSWAQDAAEGRAYRPGPGGSMIDSTLLELTNVTETEASFTACSANSLEVVDAAGNVIESSGGVTFVKAAAVRVDGEWLLRDLSQSGGDCPGPGSDA